MFQTTNQIICGESIKSVEYPSHEISIDEVKYFGYQFNEIPKFHKNSR